MGTLPRALREKHVVTAVKEDEHPEILKERQEMVKNYTPAELASFGGLGDIPVPSRIQGVFGTGDKRRKLKDQQAKKRR